MHSRNNSSRSNSNNIQEFVPQTPGHHLELGRSLLRLAQFVLQTSSNRSGLRLHFRHSKRVQPCQLNFKHTKVPLPSPMQHHNSSLRQDHHPWGDHRSHRTLESLLARVHRTANNHLSPAIRLNLRHQHPPQNSMEQVDPGYRASIIRCLTCPLVVASLLRTINSHKSNRCRKQAHHVRDQRYVLVGRAIIRMIVARKRYYRVTLDKAAYHLQHYDSRQSPRLEQDQSVHTQRILQ